LTGMRISNVIIDTIYHRDTAFDLSLCMIDPKILLIDPFLLTHSNNIAFIILQ
jgi:hypothetical protein